MNWQTLQLMRIMLNPRIMAKPLRSLARLRARNIRRLPDDVYKSLRPWRGKRAALSFITQWLDGEMLTRHHGRWVLNSFLPAFPGPAFDRMFDNLFSGRHLSPVSAFLAITPRCSCNCLHCSAGRASGDELSVAEWLKVIQQLLDMGVSIIGFTGGEPLLRDDLPALVSESTRLGLESVLFTSGVGVTMDKMAALENAGLWSCCVSLDSANAREHDQIRGLPGAFGAAVETIRLSISRGFYTMISSVATRDFVDKEMYRTIHALAREWGVNEYRIVEIMPCGKLGRAPEDILLTPTHIARLRDFHRQTNRRGRSPKVCAFNQVESAEVFGCGGGTQHLYIQPDGVVCPCDFTPLGFGNVKHAPLDGIWRRMNKAMGDNPRRECFIRKYHHLISARGDGDVRALSPEDSETICSQTAMEPLPAYFAAVCGQPQQKTHEP